MIIPTRLPEYFVAALVIILAPGPSVLFVIARAISWGKRTALSTVLGNVLGSFLLSTLVAIGVGPILQRSALAYLIVQYGGGLYLIYLGIESIRHRALHAEDMADTSGGQPGLRKSIRDGFWVGFLNPKAIVFYAGVVPQFIDRDRGQVTWQLWFLGLIFCALALICDGSWGLAAGIARQWLATSRRRLENLRAGGGVVMIILGLLVIVSALQHTLNR